MAACFTCRNCQDDPQLTWEYKRTKTAKRTLKKKNTAGRLTLANLFDFHIGFPFSQYAEWPPRLASSSGVPKFPAGLQDYFKKGP